MNALISPNEPAGAGVRVAEVSAMPFEVAAPLYWVECPADVKAETHYFDSQTSTFVLI